MEGLLSSVYADFHSCGLTSFISYSGLCTLIYKVTGMCKIVGRNNLKPKMMLLYSREFLSSLPLGACQK